MSIQTLLGTKFPENRPMDLLHLIELGLPVKSLATFKRATGLTDADIARVLNIAERTLTRIRSEHSNRLTADISDRLFSIASIYQLAEQVLGDAATAHAWLNTPQFGFAQRLPKDLLASEYGRHQVRALLQRIEHGQLA